VSRGIALKLALRAGVGPILLARLCGMRGYESLTELTSLSVSSIMERYALTAAQAALVKNGLDDDKAYAEHESWCSRNGVQVVLIGDESYPTLLRHIQIPPVALWVKGDPSIASQSACALVGSRAANVYGRRVVQMLVPELVSAGVVTVSGGARGIDAWVHEETLRYNGSTIAVMGCGLAHCYPSEHASLFDAIVLGGGALLSPFPPQVAPLPGLFPVRNRIIAGIAGSCMVVQAAVKSGALITASHAVEENREVGAVPGPIDDPLSAGTNQLIAQGARVVMDGASALELCGVSGQSHRLGALSAKEPVAVDPLLDLLASPQLLETIAHALQVEDLKGLRTRLFELQLEGLISQDHAGFWRRTR